MTQIINFPDAEALTIKILKQHFPNTPISTIIPPTHTPQKTHIKITRTGGTRYNLITDTTQILIEVYAETTTEAVKIAARARSVLFVAGQLDYRVRKVEELTGLVFLPDPDTSQPKYQFLFQLFLAGSVSNL